MIQSWPRSDSCWVRSPSTKRWTWQSGDFILCAYEADPDVLVENVQQVRAVYEHGEWRLHIVCRHETEVNPGNSVAG